jgi:hypothetical protein
MFSFFERAGTSDDWTDFTGSISPCGASGGDVSCILAEGRWIFTPLKGFVPFGIDSGEPNGDEVIVDNGEEGRADLVGVAVASF